MPEEGEVIESWVSEWEKCEACGHEWANVRPLVMEPGKGECPRCGQMESVGNGPRWDLPLGDEYD